MKHAVLLVGHGSKLAGSDSAIEQVVQALSKKDPATFFRSAFLELRSPSISEGIELCFRQGAEEVIIVPYFVQTGRHVVEDIPKIVAEAKARFPEKNIHLADYLGFDPKIVSLVTERIQTARESS
jgi:sirohydrochlorin ferrochelatase